MERYSSRLKLLTRWLMGSSITRKLREDFVVKV